MLSNTRGKRIDLWCLMSKPWRSQALYRGALGFQWFGIYASRLSRGFWCFLTDSDHARSCKPCPLASRPGQVALTTRRGPRTAGRGEVRAELSCEVPSVTSTGASGFGGRELVGVGKSHLTRSSKAQLLRLFGLMMCMAMQGLG